MKIRVDSPISPSIEDVCIDTLKPGNVFRANGAHYLLSSESSPLGKHFAVKLTNGKLTEFSGDTMVAKRNDVLLAKTA